MPLSSTTTYIAWCWYYARFKQFFCCEVTVKLLSPAHAFGSSLTFGPTYSYSSHTLFTNQFNLYLARLLLIIFTVFKHDLWPFVFLPYILLIPFPFPDLWRKCNLIVCWQFLCGLDLSLGVSDVFSLLVFVEGIGHHQVFRYHTICPIEPVSFHLHFIPLVSLILPRVSESPIWHCLEDPFGCVTRHEVFVLGCPWISPFHCCRRPGPF